MLTVSDFVYLAYSDAFTWAGIKHVCRYLVDSAWQEKGIGLEQLHQQIAEKGVELAILRYLQAQEIPYKIHQRTPFTRPDDHDISLGGRYCLIKAHLLQVGAEGENDLEMLERLYKSNALVTTAGIGSENLRNTDLAIFAFVLALEPSASRDEKGYFVHRMPVNWSSPKRSIPLGQIDIRNDSESMIELEISGTSGSKLFHSEAANIQPHQNGKVDTELSSIVTLHSEHRPEGRIYIYHPTTNRSYYIYPRQWWNLWLNGIGIIIAGYIPIAELRNTAPAHYGHKVYLKTALQKPLSIAYPIANLQAIGDLFGMAKSWQKN